MRRTGGEGQGKEMAMVFGGGVDVPPGGYMVGNRALRLYGYVLISNKSRLSMCWLLVEVGRGIEG